jgi:hypothetical protein
MDCSAKCFLFEKGLPWMMDTWSPTTASAQSSVRHRSNGKKMQFAGRCTVRTLKLVMHKHLVVPF